jgi:hypothetical protein
MALTQNVVINFLTKFDKKGLQKATKELKGFDKFIASSKFASKAALVTAGIGAAIALDRLARSSVKAALEQERLDKSIEQSLSSINELGALGSVKTFITDLQTATNITEDELTPALNGLIISTGDLTKAQSLLGTAIDTSKGSGVDLLTVSDALAKANRGNFKALGQLGLGFDAVTAKEMGLADITDYLTLKFGGAAARATDTFGAKLDDLKISAGEAQENLGQGFITAAEIIIGSSNATDVFGAKLEQLGLNGGYIVIALANSINKIQDALSGLAKKIDSNIILRNIFSFQNIPILPGLASGLGLLAKEGKKIADNAKEAVTQTEEQKAAAEKLAALQAKFDKFAAAALDKQKKLTKEKAAQAALDKKKAELESMFDMDRINLQAALSRKLSAEDELRVKILQKLRDGTKDAVDEAQKYADVLLVIKDGQITTAEVEMLAKKWNMTNAEVLLYLQGLFMANEELRKMLGLAKDIKSVITATAYPTGASMAEFRAYKAGEIASSSSSLQSVATTYPTGGGMAEFAAYRAGERAMADGGIVTKPTRALIGEAGAEAVIPLDRMGSMGTRVTVNVAGSVISEGQLQSVIQDVLYNLNRTGAVTQLSNLGR